MLFFTNGILHSGCRYRPLLAVLIFLFGVEFPLNHDEGNVSLSFLMGSSLQVYIPTTSTRLEVLSMLPNPMSSPAF